jgi:Holliday junction resolvase RusA-like endonuclease
MEPKIEFEFLGNPIPASRPRVTPRGTFYNKTYAQYKKALSKALREAFQFTIPGELKLYAEFYRATKHHVDLDNLLKSVMDALVIGCVIPDDSYITHVEAKKIHDKVNPRLFFTLEQANFLGLIEQ